MADTETSKPQAESTERRSSKQTLIFISHDTRDAEVAECFSKLLSSVSAGVLKSFRSSDRKGAQGIEYGVEWYPELMSKLDAASDVVCLLTQHSLDRPWILYEAGVAKGKLNTPVYGIAFGIPLSRANSGPFAQFQNCGDDEESLTKLVIQLVQRIPDSEPDREAIHMQVKMFTDRVDAILQKTADPDAPFDETALDDSSVAKLFEEVKVMFQDLPSRLGDKIDEHVGSRRRRRKHRFHPMMVEDLIHMAGPKSRGEVGLLILASLFREDCPWLYELGVDAYRAVQAGDTDAAQEALRTFERSVEFTLHGPMMEMFGSSKEDHMIMRDLGHMAERMLPRIIERVVPGSRDKESKESDE